MESQEPFAHWKETTGRRDMPPEPVVGADGLPPVFQFSQNTLQDYVDCARRFQLRYVLARQWPAVESEPIEEREHFIEQGAQFHLLVQRHLLGIPEEQLRPEEPLLSRWWEAYLHQPPPDLPIDLRLPEAQLSTPVAGKRLLARFDLLAIEPGQRVVIVDWKTTHRRPDRRLLAARLQTRVYPFVLVEAGAGVFGGPVRPEQINLIYWFAEAPGELEVFPYSQELHEENRAYLGGLIDEVVSRREEVWPLTEDTHMCMFCVYRSLCDRGVKAGDYRDVDTEVDIFDFNIDLDSIEEIAF
ncbi:MAG: PD-(D/E)XK nuclease family protein [Anaerolineae bacterium]|nr:PD-(D/E)XK nuclease family protein [Anaerolineae bacterium]